MTTVRLKKTMNLGAGSTDYLIYIDGARVEEDSTKEVVADYPDYIKKATWSASRPTILHPKRNNIDFLTITRSFTITGYIDVRSTDSICDYGTSPNVNREPRSASEVRDILMNMQRSGGSVYFNYGLPSDKVGTISDGYVFNADNVYYTPTGFECWFKRIQCIEEHTPVGEYRNGGTYHDSDGVYLEANTVHADENVGTTTTTTDAHGLSLSVNHSGITNTTGVKISTNKGELYLKTVVKDVNCTATRCLLKNSSYTTVDTASFSGNNAVFNYALAGGETYYVVCDASGGAYVDSDVASDPAYPLVGTNVNITSGVANGVDAPVHLYNIVSIATSRTSYNPPVSKYGVMKLPSKYAVTIEVVHSVDIM